MTGINTEVFKVHSIRSASSLNAEVTGIMEYVKEHDSNFQLGILSKQLWGKVKTSSLSDKGHTTVLDQIAKILEIEDYMRTQSLWNVIQISQVKLEQAI